MIVKCTITELLRSCVQAQARSSPSSRSQREGECIIKHLYFVLHYHVLINILNQMRWLAGSSYSKEEDHDIVRHLFMERSNLPITGKLR